MASSVILAGYTTTDKGSTLLKLTTLPLYEYLLPKHLISSIARLDTTLSLSLATSSNVLVSSMTVRALALPAPCDCWQSLSRADHLGFSYFICNE